MQKSVLCLIALVCFNWYAFGQSVPIVSDKNDESNRLNRISWKAIFEGVEQTSLKKTKPRLMVGHAVKINLQADGIQFFNTPPAEKKNNPKTETLGLKTSSFLKKHSLQVAINAAPYGPIHKEENDWQDISGLHVHKGKMISESFLDYPALLITKENKASIAKPMFKLDNVHMAVGGFQIVLADGKVVPSTNQDLHPRTAAGISQDGKTMVWLVIDGRQKGYSEGATLEELGSWLKELGCDVGINLDGGGTTTLAIESDGKAKVVNQPIHDKIPGNERVSASHLGIYAKPKK